MKYELNRVLLQEKYPLICDIIDGRNLGLVSRAQLNQCLAVDAREFIGFEQPVTSCVTIAKIVAAIFRSGTKSSPFRGFKNFLTLVLFFGENVSLDLHQDAYFDKERVRSAYTKAIESGPLSTLSGYPSGHTYIMSFLETLYPKYTQILAFMDQPEQKPLMLKINRNGFHAPNTSSTSSVVVDDKEATTGVQQLRIV